MITGFANGCFDLLHEGHLHLLKTAAMHCNRLVVAINSDASVRRLKGPDRPVENIYQRVHGLRATRLVYDIIEFNTETELMVLIAHLGPDILFKGMDYDGKTVVGARHAGQVMLVDLLPGHSTTALIERMKR